MAPSEAEIRNYIIQAARRSSRQLLGDGEDDQLAVTASTNLVGSGLFDSMGFMNFLVKVEDHFGVEVDLDNQEPSEFTSVEGLTRAVVQSLSRDR